MSDFSPKKFRRWSRFHGSRGTPFSRNPLANVSRAVLDSYARFLALRQESDPRPPSKGHFCQVQGDSPFFSPYQAFQVGYIVVFNPTTQKENGIVSLNG